MSQNDQSSSFGLNQSTLGQTVLSDNEQTPPQEEAETEQNGQPNENPDEVENRSRSK